MRSRRLSIALLLVALGGMALAGSAAACSCAPRAPVEALRDSDAAVVGRLVGVIPRGELRADYRYRILRVYRGGLRRGQLLTVSSGRGAAGCALPRRGNRRYGLLLTRARGRWQGGICGVIRPRQLWHAARHGKSAEASDAGAPTCQH